MSNKTIDINLIDASGKFVIKAKSIINTARLLVDKYNGNVPDTMDELTKYVEEHPDFMENLESDEQIDALKAGTYEKIMERIGKLT